MTAVREGRKAAPVHCGASEPSRGRLAAVARRWPSWLPFWWEDPDLARALMEVAGSWPVASGELGYRDVAEIPVRRGVVYLTW